MCSLLSGLPYPECPEPTWVRPRWTTASLPKPEGAYYDRAAADKAIKFIALLRHFKGEYAGRQFTLLPWQEHELIRPLFGWKRADGTRLYRTAYLETSKKNGKTQLAAGIGAYMAFGDGELGAEVYTYAADKTQAKIAFDALAFGIGYEGNPFEPRGIEILAREVRNMRTYSFVRVQSSDTRTKHGPNAHCICFDELHAQPNRELWDVVTTGVAARTQPLVLALTTAGWDRNSICWEQHEYVRQLAEQIILLDPYYLGVIYAAAEDDDWTDPSVWRKAAPSLNVTVPEEFYEQKCREAKQMPTAQNAFRQLFLSQWTQQAVRFIPLDKWDANDAPVDPDSLVGKPCYGGLDLASTTDLAAFALLFPTPEGAYDVLLRYFMPEDGIIARERRDRVPYRLWVKNDLITATPGDVIDYDFIMHTVFEARQTYDLREVSYDPWNAPQLILKLQEHRRLTLVPMRQGYASLSAPTKELLRLILEGKLHHNKNPVLRWNADSAAAEMDAAGNVKLNKAKSTARIDGLVAVIMALDAAIRNALKKRVSIYAGDSPPRIAPD